MAPQSLQWITGRVRLSRSAFRSSEKNSSGRLSLNGTDATMRRISRSHPCTWTVTSGRSLSSSRFLAWLTRETRLSRTREP